MSGIGVILGAGVYALIAPAAGLAGNALWLAFLLAGVAAGLTAYSYARLGTMQPKDSPEFQYTTLAFGPRIGFLAGWLMLAADLLAVAAVTLGFSGYLAYLAGTPIMANALTLLAVTGVFLLAGIGQSVALAILLTVVEAAGLVFVIVIGLPAGGRPHRRGSPPELHARQPQPALGDESPSQGPSPRATAVRPDPALAGVSHVRVATLPHGMVEPGRGRGSRDRRARRGAPPPE